MADLEPTEEARLASIAAQFVARVHDDDPNATDAWLAKATTAKDRWMLLYAVSAMVPTDRTVDELLAWLTEPAPVGGRVIHIDEIRASVAECGTLAGSRRHRLLREPTCCCCLAAERNYKRERRARAREEAQSA